MIKRNVLVGGRMFLLNFRILSTPDKSESMVTFWLSSRKKSYIEDKANSMTQLVTFSRSIKMH